MARGSDPPPLSSDFVLRLENVKKIYRRGGSIVEALRGVSLEIKPRDFIAVMGPSGSGKSTLLHIMGLLDRPSEGRVFLEGLPAHELSENQRAFVRNRKIGFVFQSFHLLPRRSALENVMLPLLYAGAGRKESEKKARKALELVGLAGRVSHRPAELSGGECQRTAIARAVVMEPALILADEPTGNLDSESGAAILRLFQTLNREQGATIVVVTHNPEVGAGCRKVLRLLDGRLEPAAGE